MMINRIKLLAAFLLLTAGIAGFYLLADRAAVLRIITVLAGLAAAVAVLWTTPVGQKSLVFLGESLTEARKVVWPTRQETIQTTMIVFVLVLIVAAFLAVIDIGFAFMVQWLMGRSA